MDARPVRPSEFGPKQELAFALTGTVALPSPFPATGQVFLLIVAGAPEREGPQALKFFLKSVQVVNSQCIATRTIARDAVRAIGYYSKGGQETRDGEWTVVPIDRLPQIALAATQAAEAREIDRSGSLEFLLFENAVLYVPESAQVLHRLEFGLTAAVSAVAPVPFTSEQELSCCCNP